MFAISKLQSKPKKKKSVLDKEPEPQKPKLESQPSITKLLADSDRFVLVAAPVNRPKPEPDCWSIVEESEETTDHQSTVQPSIRADGEDATIDDSMSVASKGLTEDSFSQFTINEDVDSTTKKEEEASVDVSVAETPCEEKPETPIFQMSRSYEIAVEALREDEPESVVQLRWEKQRSLQNMISNLTEAHKNPNFQMKTLARSIGTTLSTKKPIEPNTLGVPPIDINKGDQQTTSAKSFKSPKKFFMGGASKLLVGMKASGKEAIKRTPKTMPDITIGFDEAYIRTWAQPVLHADTVPFRVSPPEDQRAPLIKSPSQRKILPRKSSISIGSRKPSKGGMDSGWSQPSAPALGVTLTKESEVEWMEWREVEDRVVEWIRTSEPDTSHIIAMLEPEGKRVAY